jgi:putative flippase GtrA
MDDMAHRAQFAAAMTAITRRLPWGLSRVIAPSLVGYLLINLCTFFIDLGLLGLFHGTFGWPLPVAVTLSYGTASVTSYALNRVLNFRSHGYVGKQFLVFAAVSGSNYLIFVLGLTDLLSVAGVYYEFSRVIAACCEAVYLYCMMRWVVFRDADAAPAGPATRPAGPAAQAPPPTASAGPAAPGPAAQAPPPRAPAGPAAQAAPTPVTAPPSPRPTGPG